MTHSHNGPFSSSAMGYNRPYYRYPLTTDNLYSSVANRNHIIKTSQTQRNDNNQELDAEQYARFGLSPYPDNLGNSPYVRTENHRVVVSQIIENNKKQMHQSSSVMHHDQNTMPSSSVQNQHTDNVGAKSYDS